MKWSLVRAEARKLRTVRSVTGLAAAVVGFAFLATGPAWTAPAAAKAEWTPGLLAQGLRGPGWVLALAVLVIGVLATAGEVRHGTLPSMLVVAPRRRHVLVAKLVAVAGMSAALAVVVNLVMLALGLVLLRSAGVEVGPFRGDVATTAAAVVGLAVVYGAIGVGVGALVRDQTAAIVGALLWATVMENVVPIVLRAPTLAKWMPGGAARSLLTTAAPEPDLLSPLAAAALLVAVLAALAAGGTAAFVSRDVQ